MGIIYADFQPVFQRFYGGNWIRLPIQCVYQHPIRPDVLHLLHSYVWIQRYLSVHGKPIKNTILNSSALLSRITNLDQSLGMVTCFFRYSCRYSWDRE